MSKKKNIFGFWFDVQTEIDGREFVYISEIDVEFINRYCYATTCTVGKHYLDIDTE